MRVKICGMTRIEDALAAEAAGADAIGLIFAPHSKRLLSEAQAAEMVQALGPLVGRIGVFVDAPLNDVRRLAKQLRLSAVQLHGHEDASYLAALRQEVPVIRAISFTPQLTPAALEAVTADAILLDGLTPGSGQAFDWQAASWLKGWPRLILAGGLNAHTVAAGIEALSPYGVDVASGVERQAGIKDHGLIQDFVRAAKTPPRG